MNRFLIAGILGMGLAGCAQTTPKTTADGRRTEPIAITPMPSIYDSINRGTGGKRVQQTTMKNTESPLWAGQAAGPASRDPSATRAMASATIPNPGASPRVLASPGGAHPAPVAVAGAGLAQGAPGTNPTADPASANAAATQGSQAVTATIAGSEPAEFPIPGSSASPVISANGLTPVSADPPGPVATRGGVGSDGSVNQASSASPTAGAPARPEGEQPSAAVGKGAIPAGGDPLLGPNPSLMPAVSELPGVPPKSPEDPAAKGAAADPGTPAQPPTATPPGDPLLGPNPVLVPMPSAAEIDASLGAPTAKNPPAEMPKEATAPVGTAPEPTPAPALPALPAEAAPAQVAEPAPVLPGEPAASAADQVAPHVEAPAAVPSPDTAPSALAPKAEPGKDLVTPESPVPPLVHDVPEPAPSASPDPAGAQAPAAPGGLAPAQTAPAEVPAPVSDPSDLPPLPTDKVSAGPATRNGQPPMDESIQQTSTSAIEVKSPQITRTVKEAGKAAARVGDEVITLNDLYTAVKEFRKKHPTEQPPSRDEVNMMGKGILIMLIERSLLTQEAKRVLKNPKMLDQLMNYAEQSWKEEELPPLYRKYLAANVYELREKMAADNRSLDAIHESYRQDFLAQAFLMQKIGSKLKVDLNDMLKYYKEHANDRENHRPESITWRELLVENSKYPTPQLARDKAQKLLERLRKGENFAKLVKAESDGPDLAKSQGGLMETSPGSYGVASVNQAISSLPIGKVSDILEGPTSLHIVVVEKRKPAGPVSFEEIQDQIRKTIHDENFQKERVALITKMRKETIVSTIFDNTESDPNR